MAQNDLPERVCVLDLETSQLVRGEPKKTPLALVGTMVYDLRDGRYHQGPYRCFLPDELGELKELLRNFEGLVLGHNILNFDYEVLKRHISLQGLTGRTVDTLGFLYEKRSTEPIFPPKVTDDSLKGLSLDNLAQRNLGRGKGISGRSIPKMWREGRREEVIAYNKEDLVLTFSLWRWMVEGKTVVLRERDEFDEGRATEVGDRVYEPWRVEIFPEDLPRLTGRAPLYNTRNVIITDGPPPNALVWPDPEDEDDYWYRGASAQHYLREDELVIQDPYTDFISYTVGPYPADWFTFTVTHEGPIFPARLPPGEKGVYIEDLLY